MQISTTFLLQAREKRGNKEVYGMDGNLTNDEREAGGVKVCEMRYVLMCGWVWSGRES